MATYQTPKLNLHTWAPTDYVMREEFNDNFSLIDHAFQEADKKTAGTLNVKELGSVGDGVADDWQALQTAINDPFNNTVVIPDGTYAVSKTISIPANKTIVFGNKATVLRMGPGAVFMNGLKTDSFTGYNGNSNIRIIGGTVDARGDVNKTDGSAFAFAHARNISLEDVTVLNVRFSHGVEASGVDGFIVRGCTFNGFVDESGTRNFAEAIQLEHSTDIGFPYFGAGDNTITKNVIIENCTFDKTARTGYWGAAVGGHAGTDLYGAENITIRNCVVKGTLNYAFTLSSFRDISIERCDVTGMAGVKHTNNASFNTYGLRVKHCTFNVSGGDVNSVAIGLMNVETATIEDNRIVAGGNAVSVISTMNVLIYNNTLSSSLTDTVAVYTSCQNVQVVGNKFTGIGRYGVNIYDYVEKVDVIRNTFAAAASNVFNLRGAAVKSVFVKENSIRVAPTNAVILATAGINDLLFTDNLFPKGLSNPVQITAANSISYPNFGGNLTPDIWYTITPKSGWTPPLGLDLLYAKGSDNTLRLSSVLKNGTVVPGTVIASIPQSEAWPARKRYFTVGAHNSTTNKSSTAILGLSTDGNIEVIQTIDGDTLFLDSVSIPLAR